MLYNNKIQINYSVDKAQDGTVIRSSTTLSIKEDDVKSAVALYRELQKQIEGGVSQKSQEVIAAPDCRKHGIKMYLRSRKSDGQLFFGCPQFQMDGCQETAPYLASKMANSSSVT